MDDSSPSQLRAPAPRAAVLSPASTAAPTPRIPAPHQIVTVRPQAFRSNSSRTHRHALPLVKQLPMLFSSQEIVSRFLHSRDGLGFFPARAIFSTSFSPYIVS